MFFLDHVDESTLLMQRTHFILPAEYWTLVPGYVSSSVNLLSYTHEGGQLLHIITVRFLLRKTLHSYALDVDCSSGWDKGGNEKCSFVRRCMQSVRMPDAARRCAAS